MGNRSSCVCGNADESQAFTVVGPHGEIRAVEAQWAAADLMIGLPGHIVARAEMMGRAVGLGLVRAEEALEPEEVYLLMPVNQFGCRPSDRQLEVARKAIRIESKRRRRRKTKGFGSGSGSESDKRVFLEEADATGFAGKRARSGRAWRPRLDTIHEANSQ